MNNNPLDAFPYLQQMTQQFRQMFGDDFVKNLMSSMQAPTWNGGAGVPGAGAPQDPGPAHGAGPRFSEDPAATQGAPGAMQGQWPNWLSGWNPLNQGQPGATAPSLFPPVDVYETRHEVVLVLEVPGLERAGDVRISVYPDRVMVKGDRKRMVHRGLDGSVVQTERVIGPFERTISLPSRVRRQHSKATYAHGLLEIRLVKEGRSTDPDGSIVDVDFL